MVTTGFSLVSGSCSDAVLLQFFFVSRTFFVVRSVSSLVLLAQS